MDKRIQHPQKKVELKLNANEKQSHFTQDSNVFISVCDFMEQQTQIFHEKKRCTVGDLTSSLLHVTHATFSLFIDKSILETIVEDFTHK